MPKTRSLSGATKSLASDALYQEVVERVDTVLRRYFEMREMLTAKHASHHLLWESLHTVVMGGGKRLRPYLVVLGYLAAGTNLVDDDILHAAAGWELLHQSMLIHDDIIDRDFVRHGHPNMSGLYREHYDMGTLSAAERDHYANSAALLAGDLALSAAYQLVLGSGFAAAKKQAGLQLLGHAIDIVALGELQDTEAPLAAIEHTDALQIAEMKSASYSFVGPLQLGALLGGMDAVEIPKLVAFGTALGIAYQLRDDWLGVFGDAGKTGKSTANDIREGKRTLLVTHTYEAATPAERQLMEGTLGNLHATSSQLAAFRKLTESTGAKQRLEDNIIEYTAEAQAALQAMKLLPQAVRDRMLILAEQLVARQS